MIHHIARLPLSRKDGITILPFGDLQYGAGGFSEESWEAFRNEFKSTPNCYALGLGDYEDFTRPSMRGRVIPSLGHDDSTRLQFDNMVRRDQDKLINKMAFLEGRLLGIHNGHHCWEFGDGTNSDQRLASALKAPYLGWMASTRLSLRKQHGGKVYSGYTYTIVSMHGQANARRTGGAAAWFENNHISARIADHYIMGHNCKSMAWVPNERRTVRREGPPGEIISLPRALNVGGFHSGYTDGWQSSYVERAGFAPQPIGWGWIRLKETRLKALRESRGIRCADGYVLVADQANHHPAKLYGIQQD